MDDKVLDAMESGYDNYKDIHIKKIEALNIKTFRSLKDKTLDLGNVITIISGKNGTMKSTILGLIAHPFSSPNDAKDVFGNPLKTRHSDVFYLSPEKDSEQYSYSLVIKTIDDIIFEEPIRVYKRRNPNGTYRHRVTVGKDNVEGKGNFSLNTSYVNLKRLLPIVDTNAQPIDEKTEKSLAKFVADGYMKILQKEAFADPVEVTDKGKKQTFGPGKDEAYDYKAISSGEDNIGNILSKMHAFLEYKTANKEELQGIFCIDEIEASLHPVAQVNLFNFIFNWAKNNNIQVVINTHSLYLIQYVFELQEKLNNKNDLVLNMISTAYVRDNNYNIIKNPTYSEAYKELTLKDVDDIDDVYKVNVICEDDVAEYFLKRIISKKEVLSRFEFIHSLNDYVEGNGCNNLKALIKNGQRLLENSIIIFDPDVNTEDIKKYKSRFLSLPSQYEMPIEKEIVKFIYDLPGDDDFFIKFKKERNWFLNDFTKFDINNVNNLDEVKKDNVKKYKNWSKSCQSDFKKYITYFTKREKNIVDDFREQLQKQVNDLLLNKGLPGIELLK